MLIIMMLICTCPKVEALCRHSVKKRSTKLMTGTSTLPYLDSLSCCIHCYIFGPVSPHGSQNKPYSRYLLDVAMAPGEGWRNWPPGVVAQCQGHWRVVRATRKNPSLRQGKGVIFAISNEQLFLPHWSGVHPWGNFGLTMPLCFKQKEKRKTMLSSQCFIFSFAFKKGLWGIWTRSELLVKKNTHYSLHLR